LILLFQGWRLDPILQFGQFLLTGAAIFFAVETMRLRASTAEQARRNSPFVEEDRPTSRVYRAELDQLEAYEDQEVEDSPRLRGYVEPPSRTTKSRRSSEPPRRPSRGSGRPTNSDSYYDAWGESTGDLPPSQPRKTRPSRPRKPETTTPTTSRGRKRPSSRPSSTEYGYYSDYPDTSASDYVDYQPIDSPEVPRNEESPDRGRKPNSEPPSNFDY